MRKRVGIFTVMAFFAVAAIAVAAGAPFHDAKPSTYDPANTDLAHTGWHDGTGCPTNRPMSTDGAKKPNATYTDPACPSGDAKDNHNQGLLLVKDGPTAQYTAAVADLKDVKGQTLSELGYDIRTGDGNPTENSHCGAGAPRFDVTLTDGTTWFIGCSSPATLPTTTNNGQGWKRLRWGPGPINASNDGTTTVDISGRTVQSIQVVFDEGQDNGSGVAFLDNVDVNGALVGRGEHGDH